MASNSINTSLTTQENSQPGAPLVRQSFNWIENKINKTALIIFSGALTSCLIYLLIGSVYALILFTAIVIAAAFYYFSPQEGELSTQHSEAYNTMQYVFTFVWAAIAFEAITQAFRRPMNNYRRSRGCTGANSGPMPSNHPTIPQRTLAVRQFPPEYYERKNNRASSSSATVRGSSSSASSVSRRGFSESSNCSAPTFQASSSAEGTSRHRGDGLSESSPLNKRGY